MELEVLEHYKSSTGVGPKGPEGERGIAKHCENCGFFVRLMGSYYCENKNSKKYLSLVGSKESCSKFEESIDWEGLLRFEVERLK